MKNLVLFLIIVSFFISCKKEEPFNSNTNKHITYTHWYKTQSNSLDTLFHIYIPNAFTPGTGDLNEIFRVESVGLTNLKVSIFDRFGELIYEWTNISGGWDGTYKGKPAQDGTYMYSITATGIDYVSYRKTGYVTLLRNQ